ncbi:histidine kinase [Alicyclobacillus fodiniaquatilis]|uniref:Histidine kinase n=1 Tax=Alicyclobacillus fodiniaquatilis TaxID=1661150 RepID=A0ABW4JNI2_9BACL
MGWLSERAATPFAFCGQIKPHFLYNARITISALCDVEPKRAGDVTIELAHNL